MTRNSFLRSGLLIGCLSLMPVLLIGQRAGRWQYLGEANVDGNADHDKIEVGKSKGAFTKLQILVQNAPVDFDRVVVRYADGQQLPVAITSKIPAGGKTRQIDLPGVARQVDQVEVWYRKGPWSGGKPKIRLMGIH